MTIGIFLILLAALCFLVRFLLTLTDTKIDPKYSHVDLLVLGLFLLALGLSVQSLGITLQDIRNFR